jgi:predicted ATPase
LSDSGCSPAEACSGQCRCALSSHEGRLVVITGGPGAGKTALLELVRRHFCEHIAVLPEAAGVVFGGGFPRRASLAARRAAQRAIYHIQRQMERLTVEEGRAAVILCDRGTLDGLAYWPADHDEPGGYFADLGISHAAELRRYAAVIHLRTPAETHYNRDNPLRVEGAREAAVIDARIAEAWEGHPRHEFVGEEASFFDKVRRAIDLIRLELPECCRQHTVTP